MVTKHIECFEEHKSRELDNSGSNPQEDKKESLLTEFWNRWRDLSETTGTVFNRLFKIAMNSIRTLSFHVCCSILKIYLEFSSLRSHPKVIFSCADARGIGLRFWRLEFFTSPLSSSNLHPQSSIISLIRPCLTPSIFQFLLLFRLFASLSRMFYVRRIREYRFPKDHSLDIWFCLDGMPNFFQKGRGISGGFYHFQ